ncbi:uncharacterized protein LOC117433771 isoform X3 [Acipenser ruthenus]|uniref:uncharacterized protein LOC117433771 isoform X3 n=1 Tax=Acipenser ruthenus TaxID=7906 RepID=UPI00145B2E05|nr:uncharacterized protein LOC117433771 isoform X3 [Acipenser ruthenus]XP_033912075.1 uncharacterized protein LOC117433771 isoform X3 [Acipenser ruthenus]
MLRILILCFMLKAAASLEMEGSSGDFPDDEDLHGFIIKEAQTSPSSWIIPVAVTAGLAVFTVLVIAGVLIRKRSRSQQQGVYTVPVEQSKKEAV